MKDEHSLFSELGEPRADAGDELGRLLVGHEPPRRVDKLQLHELRDGVDETRPAQSLRLDVPDHLRARPSSRLIFTTSMRARRRPHAAPDGGALERRAGRGGGGEEPVAVAEHELAVRADVQEQPDPRVAIHARCQEPGDDVAADVGAEGGEDHGTGTGVDPDSDVRRQDLGEQPRRHNEGRHPERLGIDAERDVGHGGIAGDRDLVDL